eukprot:TRINITY_DN13372_c0_g1_i1.p1 TRINITY_DN13372_c0_g1~~TRINITY_DN13372_c0_g1_i1.p1  ORF type:complete len:291 (+),score=76.59 TRINITY_DN13372_c0_g1_i1:49-873(+)
MSLPGSEFPSTESTRRDPVNYTDSRALGSYSASTELLFGKPQTKTFCAGTECVSITIPTLVILLLLLTVSNIVLMHDIYETLNEMNPKNYLVVSPWSQSNPTCDSSLLPCVLPTYTNEGNRMELCRDTENAYCPVNYTCSVQPSLSCCVSKQISCVDLKFCYDYVNHLEVSAAGLIRSIPVGYHPSTIPGGEGGDGGRMAVEETKALCTFVGVDDTDDVNDAGVGGDDDVDVGGEMMVLQVIFLLEKLVTSYFHVTIWCWAWIDCSQCFALFRM